MYGYDLIGKSLHQHTACSAIGDGRPISGCHAVLAQVTRPQAWKRGFGGLLKHGAAKENSPKVLNVGSW